MNAKREEVKALAISRLMAGDSYRSVQTQVQETFGESVSLAALSAWTHADPETAQNISQAHLRAIGHQRIRIAHKAGDLLEQRLDDGDIPHPEVTFGIASDKLDSMLKIVQDDKKHNANLDAIRAELRQKQPHELRALLAERRDDRTPPPPPPSTVEIQRYHGLDN
jgi:hypothetical protein